MPKTKNASDYLGHRVTVQTTDNDVMEGRFLGYDKHLNLILSDCERTRPLKNGGFQRRALGFVVLRGKFVASITVRRGVTTARTMVDQLGGTAASGVSGQTVADASRAARAAQGPHAGLDAL